MSAPGQLAEGYRVNPAQLILTSLLQIYRWTISPAKSLVFGPLGRCRFSPSCSAYALKAVQVHGATRGTWLATKRLCRCHPWGGCGYDPVPPTGRSEDARQPAPSWRRWSAAEQAAFIPHLISHFVQEWPVWMRCDTKCRKKGSRVFPRSAWSAPGGEVRSVSAEPSV